MHRIDRRMLLRGAGGVALGLPLLEAMTGGRARAASPEALPKRLIVLYQTQGVLMDAWTPRRGQGGDYTFGPILDTLSSHKQDMVVLTGIDDATCLLDPINAHERAAAHLLTGAKMLGTSPRDAASASLDHVIAERISPPDLPFKTLHLAARAPAVEISFSGARAPVDRLSDPLRAFQLVFGGVEQSSPSAEPDPAEVRRRARRSLVLDTTREGITSMSRGLGAQDRQTLDAYLTRVEGIERRIRAAATPVHAACTTRAPRPARSPARTRPEPRGFDPLYDSDVGSPLMIDLIVEALACDRTRVVTMAWSQPNAYEWLRDAQGRPIAVDDWHQDVVHLGGGTAARPRMPERDWLTRVQSYYHGQIDRLLSALKAVPEGDGTLLDQCLVLSLNEFSDGARHSHLSKPCFIAGRLGGAIRTGQWIALDGVPHNRLLLSVLRAFGFDDTSFGDADHSRGGPIAGLS